MQLHQSDCPTLLSLCGLLYRGLLEVTVGNHSKKEATEATGYRISFSGREELGIHRCYCGHCSEATASFTVYHSTVAYLKLRNSSPVVHVWRAAGKAGFA